MAPRSRIETDLSEADLAEFRRLLATGRLTIDALTTWLESQGYEISRSSVGRYAQNFEEVAAKLRQGREMAETLVREIGPATIDGKQGRLLVEMLRKLAQDSFVRQLNNEADGLDPKDFAFLAKALKEMAQANRLDQDYELKIRREVEAEIKAQAAVHAETAAREGGASEEQVTFIRAKILGIGDQVNGHGT